MKVVNNRSANYHIDDIFLNRHSPRAMSGESVSQEELMTLFEAARWAPSAMNHQPWRFVYAIHGTENFDNFLALLNESNQVWSKKAGVIIIVISDTLGTKREPSLTHSLETGMAVENLLLQGTTLGLVVHPIGGIKRDLIREFLNLPDNYAVECGILIGRSGNVDDLPEELKEREKPSQRKNLEEIAFEGGIKE